MLCRGLLIFTALGFVVASAPSARADMCFAYTKTGGGVLVMQGVNLPAPNTCQPVAMYEALPGAFLGAGTGMICQDGQGQNTIVFQYTFDGCKGYYFESGICRLQLGENQSLPTISSSCRLIASDSLSTHSTAVGNTTFYTEVDDAVISSCDSKTLYVPGSGGAICHPGATPHRGEPATNPSSGTRAK